MRLGQAVTEGLQWRWTPCVALIGSATVYALLMALVMPAQIGAEPSSGTSRVAALGESSPVENALSATRPPRGATPEPAFAPRAAEPRPTYTPPTPQVVMTAAPALTDERPAEMAPRSEPPPPPQPHVPDRPPEPVAEVEAEEEDAEEPSEPSEPADIAGARRPTLAGPLRMLPAPMLPRR
ncbi:MAG: hypothetical protein KF718_06935 [Polyangiaceae bacterium]|nr:hypothetical protein [Polyangiaceae bacterium]